MRFHGGCRGEIFKIDTPTLLQMAFPGLIKALVMCYSIHTFLGKFCRFRKQINKQNCSIKILLWCSHSLHYDHIIYNNNNKQLERFLESKHLRFALIETLKYSISKNRLHTYLIQRMPFLPARIVEIMRSLINLTCVRFLDYFFRYESGQ